MSRSSSSKMVLKSVTVVLPAHNEAETIQRCVATFMLHPSVFEVLVVSNGSTDATACLARDCGVRVLELESSGKGLAMSVGAKASSTPITVFIDSDTMNPRADMLTKLLKGNPGPTRIVKGNFERTHQPGPVTDILVKPVLELMGHPGSQLVQPLSGLLACSSSWIASLTLPKDFGVDLDIVLTALATNIEVVEVDVGSFEHRVRPWTHYQGMARQVANVLCKHAII